MMITMAIAIVMIRTITTATTPPIIASETCAGSSSLLLSTAGMSVEEGDELAVGVRDPKGMEVILFHSTVLMV